MGSLATNLQLRHSLAPALTHTFWRSIIGPPPIGATSS